MVQANRSMEVGTGLFVLLGFAALGFLTTQLPGSGLQLARGSQTYTVTAKFDNIGGLKVGAPVTMAGVRVGTVEGISYDTSAYKALVKLRIDRRYDHIPDDSDAAIQTSGLLGANYISINPGGSDQYLHAGGELQFTQSALVLESLINKFFASTASSRDSGGKEAGGGGDQKSSGKPAK